MNYNWLLNKYDKLENVRIYGNCHGRVKLDFEESHLAGQWLCEDGFLTIEDFIKPASDKANKQQSDMCLWIYSDSCGAGGIWYSAIKSIYEGTLNVSPYLLSIDIHCTGDFDDQTYGGKHGGVWSEKLFKKEEMSCYKDTEIMRVEVGPNKTTIFMRMKKQGNFSFMEGELEVRQSFRDRIWQCATCGFLNDPRFTTKCKGKNCTSTTFLPPAKRATKCDC